MPRSERRQMARPRGQATASKRAARKSGSPWSAVGQAVLKAFISPSGQQLLAVAVILFGLLTLFTIAGLNSGALVNAWARALVFIFGWGAFPVAGLLVALGLLWLRNLVHCATAWRWRPFLGFELTLISALTLTHTLLSTQSWSLVESGRGGGLLGFGLSFFFVSYFGVLITIFFMLALLLLGLGLAFDLTGQDVKAVLSRLAAAWQAQWATRKGEATVDHLGAGVAVSPVTPRSRPARAQAAESAATVQEEAPVVLPVEETPSRPVAPRSSELPPFSLLKAGRAVGMNQEEIRQKSRIIEETLAQFGIPATVTEVRLGPTVTQFGVSPGYVQRGANGEEQRKVRVSQIASLSNDLALALAARSLRVEAPVPGRAVVGIEVPNAEIDLVTLRRVLESETYEKCKSPLCFAVGLDVAGSAIVADLAAMPHLLIAGTTGSGKSIFVKSLAASLVMRNAPEALRIVAIDPKMVELSQYNGLPHLLGRAETDLERILRVLRWVAYEMDQRYKHFAEAVARNLDDYNRKLARKKEPLLPRIVVLIDELADLMMAAPDETERLLTRIAQMARATGIHLVVATQRPSTDVVTGLIKANFPARISFATASNVDSRVILDSPGAESLLGQGDMLFLPPDASAPRRVQGCYISDSELEAIIKFWQKAAGATPAQAPWEKLAEKPALQPPRSDAEAEDEALLEQAIALARSRGHISTSALQRRLRISYPRAARLMEEMESRGIVSLEQQAGRPRRVILGGEEDDF